MITITDWYIKRNRFIKTIDDMEIAEEEWQDFLTALLPKEEFALPQANTVLFVKFIYPTICKFIQDSRGKAKLYKKLYDVYYDNGFFISIKETIVNDNTFTISYIIGAAINIEQVGTI